MRFWKYVLAVMAFGVVMATAGLYVAAKVHFFRRFSGDAGAYWAEHWPYTAGLLAGVMLLCGVAWLTRRMARKELA